MTTTVTVDVHDTPPDNMACEIVVRSKETGFWWTVDAPYAAKNWEIWSHWHMPIDVTIVNKETP